MTQIEKNKIIWETQEAIDKVREKREGMREMVQERKMKKAWVNGTAEEKYSQKKTWNFELNL